MTDNAGRFTFDNIPAGDYRFTDHAYWLSQQQPDF
jgi:hypothetical protein